jgi:putative endonuclease
VRAFLSFMFTVYVLYSETHDKIYVGFTSSLEERFKSHNDLGKKGWTIRFRPWLIVHKEFFESKSDAMRREKELKSASGREWIRRNILNRR